MDWWQAIILGLVEGLTEYLPVSSTGHLRLAQQLMGIADTEASRAYAVCIQGGAIVAVLGLYWRRVWQMVLGLIGRNLQGRQLLINIVAGFVPALVLGLLLEKRIDALMSNLWFTVVAWILGGIAILVVAQRRRRMVEAVAQSPAVASPHGLELFDLTWKMALIIGFAQCVAMWPGTSRSLMTIVAGVLVGLRLAVAVEFSFLLGVVTLSAAAGYKGLKYHQTLFDSYGIVPLLIGFLFAFLSAVLAIKWMVAYLQSHGMAIFGWYRVALAIIVAVLILLNVIAA